MAGLKYLLKISSGTLLVVFLAIFGVRSCGLSQTFSPHQHSLFDVPQPWLLIQMGGRSPEEFFGTHPSSSDLPLWKVSPQDFKDSEQLGKLVESLTTDPRPLGLELLENHPGFAEDLAQLILDQNLGERIVILSPHDGLLKDLRAKTSSPLFSLGQGDTTQILLLNSLFLEPVAQMGADFLILGQQFLDSQQQVHPRLRREMSRRGKTIFLDLRLEENLSNFWTTGSEGYVLPETYRPKDALDQLRSKEYGQKSL